MVANQATPTSAPATNDAAVPTRLIAPLVPGGARLQGLVTMTGGVGERIPSSEDHVSPLQAAKKLRKRQHCVCN